MCIAGLWLGGFQVLMPLIGYFLGSVFGSKYQLKAEVAGGIIWIIIGVKILLAGIGVLGCST